MKNTEKEIRYFLFSQEFADGLRITAAILLPSLLFSFFGQLDRGMTISLGALCVSIVDSPGPLRHKRNGMIACIYFTFVVSLVTLILRTDAYLLGGEIFFLTFFFSLFPVYGMRAAAVGSAAILVMILTMERPVPASDVLQHSLLILCGGIWYMTMSLLFHIIQPFRPAQRALGESIRELSKYLHIKSQFYDTSTDLEKDYVRLIAQHVVVSEKQDNVREILYKSRQMVKEPTPAGSSLVLTFTEVMDLFEEVTATYYDYTDLRRRFADSEILRKISILIRSFAHELDVIGLAIQSNTKYEWKKSFGLYIEEIRALTERHEDAENNLVLKKIIVQLQRLEERIRKISDYFQPASLSTEKIRKREYHRFVLHQRFDLKLLADNLNMNSLTFRHALRVAIGCLAGFIVAKMLSYGQYSYWIILTIAFIMKPAFSLTRQRNVERLIGTLAGGLIGVLILYFIPNKNVQFVFLVLFMVGTYSFQRTRYLVMVTCVTPFVLILFSMVGVGFEEVAEERILDTLIGCTIAFTGSYLLFPDWERDQLRTYMTSMLRANAHYLWVVVSRLSGSISLTDYKLARKEVYLSSANLSAAFQRMLSEPANKQKNKKQVHQFVVLNHILFSNSASLRHSAGTTIPVWPEQLLRLVRRSLSALESALTKLDPLEEMKLKEQKIPSETSDDMPYTAMQELLKEQLEFILRICTDLDKIAEKLATAVPVEAAPDAVMQTQD